MSALAPCQADPVDLAIEVIAAVTAEDQDVLLEVHDHPVGEDEVEKITAATHVQTRVEDVGDQEVEAMTHEIRVDEERCIRKKENQVVMATDPEIEAT